MKSFLTTAAILLSASTAFASGHGNPGAHFIENWDTNGDAIVTLDEATERREDVFNAFDADSDDILNTEEYDQFDEARANDMKETGMGAGKGQNNPANGMAREFTDQNSNGTVSRAEFKASVPDWFAQIDKNSDGVVTKDDFAKR
ncbi:EF-hand domain-containing protein [Lentibacter sp.]|uniref:EF-hand domain-containing protein n=1 Tax=Lentibacter sp. TaxID=2024994 RepID=UPI003F6A4E55